MAINLGHVEIPVELNYSAEQIADAIRQAVAEALEKVAAEVRGVPVNATDPNAEPTQAGEYRDRVEDRWKRDDNGKWYFWSGSEWSLWDDGYDPAFAPYRLVTGA